MVFFVSSGAIMPFVLLIVLLAVGSVYTVVDFFCNYWVYFALASAILLVIRTLIVVITSYEKWQAILYFVFEVIRIPLTYLTLVWYTNDWIATNNILSFVLKAGVEGLFVLPLTGISITLPWSIFDSDDFAWVLPLFSMLLLVLPLGLRMVVEYVNVGNLLPIELLSKIFS